MEPLPPSPGAPQGASAPLPRLSVKPSSWKFKRGQKEADFKTHLCVPRSPPAPLWPLLQAPQGLCCPWPVPGRAETIRFPGRGEGGGRGQLWGGRERYQ